VVSKPAEIKPVVTPISTSAPSVTPIAAASNVEAEKSIQAKAKAKRSTGFAASSIAQSDTAPAVPKNVAHKPVPTSMEPANREPIKPSSKNTGFSINTSNKDS